MYKKVIISSKLSHDEYSDLILRGLSNLYSKWVSILAGIKNSVVREVHM